MILHALYVAVCNLQVVASTQAGVRSNNHAVPNRARQTGRTVIGDVLQGEFAIVSVGTAEHGAITEIAALRVAAGLLQVAEFNVLVKPECGAQPEISLHDAMRQLAAFVKRQPLFTHNAPIDRQLLEHAAMQHGVQLDNPFHDSQLVAWSAWPGLPSYQLAPLAELLGLDCQPTHQARATAHATLALLRAASQPLGSAHPQLDGQSQQVLTGTVAQSG